MLRQGQKLSKGISRLSSLASRGAGVRAKSTLPSLPYDFGALEPVVNTEIMTLHHGKHHATYVNNLNAALEKMSDAMAKQDYATMIALQGAIQFNGGGHLNHSIFWQNLCPVKDVVTPNDANPELGKAIEAQWGSLDNFKTEFNTKTAAIQGSGWGWLGYNKQSKKLEFATCANQDPLVMKGLVPLLGIDVWEHAYYLQYKNARPEYLKQIWQVVNWKDVAARYEAAKKN